MHDLRCSFCYRNRTDVPPGIAGARVYICGECVAVAVKLLIASDHSEDAVHPATEEFFNQILAFREQLETDHMSREEHAAWESELEVLEQSVRRIRERIASAAKV